MDHCTSCQVGQGRDCACRDSLTRVEAVSRLLLLCASAWAALAVIVVVLLLAGKGLAA